MVCSELMEGNRCTGEGTVVGDGDDTGGVNDGGSIEDSINDNTLNFRWWCEHGLAANSGKIASEFSRWRRLVPVRFCITGPPGSSVRELGERLAQRYNLVLLAYEDLLEEQR